jgi:GNAT superfamily N-acetyltransferase
MDVTGSERNLLRRADRAFKEIFSFFSIGTILATGLPWDVTTKLWPSRTLRNSSENLRLASAADTAFSTINLHGSDITYFILTSSCFKIVRIIRSLFMPEKVHIRVAVPADIPVLRSLIDASVRKLQIQDYTSSQIENALQTVFGVDSQLIADGTYLLAETNPAEAGLEPLIAGCGGWSKRKTLYGGDRWAAREDGLLDPFHDAAKIRSFFIHPEWARRGIGSMILDACEAAARSAGFTRLEMGATLTGVKLFQARGYVAIEHLEIPVGNGISLPIVRMEKRTEID